MCVFKDFSEKSLCFFDICKGIEPVNRLFAVNTAVKSQEDEAAHSLQYNIYAHCG